MNKVVIIMGSKADLPYIFLGYGLAGILGPVIGGLIFDLSGNYSYGAYVAAILSITGAFILLFPVNSNKS